MNNPRKCRLDRDIILTEAHLRIRLVIIRLSTTRRDLLTGLIVNCSFPGFSASGRLLLLELMTSKK
jgi:hypothetical protein